MRFATETLAVMRLDFGEVRRSRWLVFSAGAYALLAGIFVLVGLRESSVLGFTGMGRVLLSLCHALLLILPLLALSATCQAINRSRDDGTLEILFSHPLSRTAYLTGVTLTRSLVLAVPLIVLVLGMAAIAGFAPDAALSWRFTLRAIAVSVALLWACVGIGIAISTLTRNQSKATVYGLLAWAAGVALLDFAIVGLMLQYQLNPRTVFVIAAMNPVQSARMALLSGIATDLGTLGPVGFYLAHRVGAAQLLALALGWSSVVGCAGFGIALRAFRRGDVI